MDLKEIPTGYFLRHPWELARVDFFKYIVLDSPILSNAKRILDAGSGDGFFIDNLIKALQNRPDVVCWDAHFDAEDVSDPHYIKTKTKPDGKFDLVILLDVLEHVEEDESFLYQLSEVMVSGGHLLFSVPAWQWLYTGHDKALGHFRRYKPATCQALLNKIGLIPQMSGGVFHSLVMARGLQKVINILKYTKCQKTPNSLKWDGGRLTHKLITSALKAENVFSYYMAKNGRNCIPGLSWWALCEKK